MTDRALLLDALLADPGKAAEIPADERQRLAAQLAAVQIALLAMPSPPPPAAEPAPRPKAENRLLTVDEVAARCRKSKRWVLDHWKRKLPFGRKVGRSIVFPEIELEKWLRRV